MYVSHNPQHLRNALEIDTDIFVERNTSTSTKISMLRKFFKAYGANEAVLVFYLKDSNVDTAAQESGTRYETCRSIHAEQNAIIQAGQDRCKGSTMYIWGHNFICILCKRFIVQSGIKDVVLRKDENSPILHVTVDDIRRELEED